MPSFCGTSLKAPFFHPRRNGSTRIAVFTTCQKCNNRASTHQVNQTIHVVVIEGSCVNLSSKSNFDKVRSSLEQVEGLGVKQLMVDMSQNTGLEQFYWVMYIFISFYNFRINGFQRYASIPVRKTSFPQKLPNPKLCNQEN